MKRNIRFPAVLIMVLLALLVVIKASMPKEETVVSGDPPVEIVEPMAVQLPEDEPAVPMAAAQTPAEPAFSAHELEILAIIIYREAGGDACSDKTRQMVGEVFLNRVADPRFPDSFEAVATQRSQYGRLHWTGICWPARASDAAEAHAVHRAYRIAEELLCGASARLLPTDTVYQAEFVQGEVVTESDGLYFCR